MKKKKIQLIVRKNGEMAKKEQDKCTGAVESRKKKEENERVIVNVFNGITIKEEQRKAEKGFKWGKPAGKTGQTARI